MFHITTVLAILLHFWLAILWRVASKINFKFKKITIKTVIKFSFTHQHFKMAFSCLLKNPSFVLLNSELKKLFYYHNFLLRHFPWKNIKESANKQARHTIYPTNRYHFCNRQNEHNKRSTKEVHQVQNELAALKLWLYSTSH